SPVSTVAVTHGAANSADDVAAYARFLKVSNTSGGAPAYTEGVDWRFNPDLRTGQIDWSPSGAEPAAGATYYVTYTSAATASTTNFTLSGHTVTLSTAPTANQAVYVEYVHGTHSSDGSTLAYQQTSAGDGGFNSIYIDSTYTSRYLGKYLAIGY